MPTGDAAFIWNTNIEQVAGRIDSGLQRIGSSIRGLGSGATLTFAENLGAGIEQRIQNVVVRAQTQMLQSARQLEQTIARAAPGTNLSRGGAPLDTRSAILRGGFDDPGNVFNQVNRQFTELSKQIDAAITGTPLEGQRAEIQQRLRIAAEQTVDQLQRFYATVARDMQQVTAEARAARGITGTRTLSTLPRSELDRYVREATILRGGADAGPAEAALARGQLGLAGGATRTETQAAEAAIKDLAQATRQAADIEQRLIAELNANRTASGALRDPAGARSLGGGVVRDAAGGLFEFDPEIGGFRPREPFESDLLENEYQESLRRRTIVEDQRVNQLETEARDAAERKQRDERAFADRRAALAGQIEAIRADRDLVGGAARVGNVVRTREGDLLQFTDRGQGLEQIPEGTKQRLAAEEAMARRDQQIIAAKERERRAQERITRQTEARAGGVGAGAGGGGGSRIDRLFGRAFGGEGRGLGFDDVVTSGLSFSRYIIAATAFAATFKVLQEVQTALLDYADSLKELEIALESTDGVQRRFTNSLQAVSRFTGENPGAALDTAARGIRAFTDAADSEALKERFGEDFAQSVTELAVITNKSLADATGDLIAASNVFEASFDRINDAIASSKQATGADPDEIAQGLANLGAAAREAGFDVETTAQIVGTVSARTDQSGNAAATRLSRILSIAGGSAGQSAIATINSQIGGGIDQSVPVAEQLRQLADIYPQLTSAQQAFIRNSVGGTANSREFVTLINEFDSILQNTEDSYRNTGEAADQFNAQIENLRGTVNQIIGSMKNIVVQLADAGLFDIFVLAVEAAEPLLLTVEKILQLYNTLPRALKSAVGATLAYAAATSLLTKAKLAQQQATAGQVAAEATLTTTRAASTVTNLGAAVAFPPGTFRGGARIRDRLGNAALTGGNVLAVAGRDGVRAASRTVIAGLGNVFTRLGRFLATPAGAAVIGLGGLLTAVELARAGSELGETRRESDALLRGGAPETAQLRDFVARIQEQSVALEEASSGVFGRAVDFLTGRRASRDAAAFEGIAESYNDALDRVQERVEGSLREGRDVDLIDLSSAEGLAEGLSALEENGRSATTRLEALYQAIGQLGEEAEQARTGLFGRDAFQFAEQLAPDLEVLFQSEANLREALSGQGEFTTLISNALPIIGDDITEAVLRVFGQGDDIDVSNLLREADFDENLVPDLVNDFLRSTGGRFNREDQAIFSDVLFDQLASQIDFDSLPEGEQEQLRRIIEQQVRNTVNSVVEVTDEYILISTLLTEGLQLVQARAEEAGRAASLAGDVRGGELAQAQVLVQEQQRLLATARSKGADEKQLQVLQGELDQALLDLQQAQRARIGQQTQLAQSALPESLDVERTLLDIERVKQELSIATDRGEVDALTVELNDLQRALEDLALSRVQAARRAALDPRDRAGEIAADLRDARERLDQFASRGDTVSEGYSGALVELRQAERAAVEFELDRAAARRTALVDPRDTVGRARADLTTAIARLEDSLQGSPEYYDALAEVREAQVGLAEEEAALASARRRVGVDSRSAVETARADLADASAELRLTLRGTAAYYEALVEYSDAQRAFSDALLNAQSLARQVAIDLTDPVATTAEALLTAQQRLNQAISEGAPRDVLDELRIEEQQAQAAAEAAAFQQRFNDARTARELGRISHAEYLAYLNEEAARLRAVQDRTRQQQEQLDQVEQALKSASEALSAQFNLGDIDVPTPFEVRRSIEESLGGTFAVARSGVSNVVTNETTIYIDGTDLSAVQRIIEDAVGTRAVRRFAGSGRK